MSETNIESKIMVKIYGEEYPITGWCDEARMNRIAQLVDERMGETARSTGVHARDKVAILAALSLASELLEATENQHDDDGSVSSRLDSVLTRLDQAIAG
jgi:cell division protein ZapA (FtsZ GTPase activity inhibitor)